MRYSVEKPGTGSSIPKLGDFTGDLSFWSLIGSNLFSIVLAFIQGWDISVVLWVYWLQSVGIGIVNVIKILLLEQFSTEGFQINHRAVDPTASTKISTAAFFAFHYGFFHLIYAVFLSVIPFTRDALTKNDYLFIAVSGGVFFVNHLFSYFYNRKSEFENHRCPNIGTIMFQPYIRIFPMHLFIIFGSALTIITGLNSFFALLFFLGLKSISDLFMHMVEHATSEQV